MTDPEAKTIGAPQQGAPLTEQSNPPGVWPAPQVILVILAHPDDPEFFCGATIARWVSQGHTVRYCLITCGDKGTKDRQVTPEALCSVRQAEQHNAARVLGVEAVRFLGYEDGYVTPDLNLRKDIVRVIRQERPDIVVTCDPTTLFIGEERINHPDHRAAGQAVIDAVFPAAGDYLFFVDLLDREHLEPHKVLELWASGSQNPTVTMDVTDLWETKITALYEHKSQIGEPAKLAERMRARRAPDSTVENPRYEEKFRRIILG